MNKMIFPLKSVLKITVYGYPQSNVFSAQGRSCKALIVLV